MATRSGEVGYDQLHHFIATGVWDSAPMEAALLKEANRLVGDERGFLVIDDTALPKKGQHSVGVAPQYASALGKTSNCQSLVSVTLASREVPVMVGLRLFLPETWTNNPERMTRAHIPRDRQVALTNRRSPSKRSTVSSHPEHVSAASLPTPVTDPVVRSARL